MTFFCNFEHVNMKYLQTFIIARGKLPVIMMCLGLLLPPWQRRLFLVALVCLSVCLSVRNITQRVMNRFYGEVQGGKWKN